MNRAKWGIEEIAALDELLQLALMEDIGAGDVTTLALVPEGAIAQADIVFRQQAVVAGLAAVDQVFQAMDRNILLTPKVYDGDLVEPGVVVATLQGPARGLLTGERTALNLLGRLSGIAWTTQQFVQAVATTQAKIFDTRKTMLGWRTLEKYAVRAGGGNNHRQGLFDAVLIKDNHLAFGGNTLYTPAQAVQRSRESVPTGTVVEIEVDTLDQFREVLPVHPDIVLLDNMTNDQLRQAVVLRNNSYPDILLEASGGVSLHTVEQIAQTGVDRISVGSLTHSAPWLDVGLDWQS